QHEGLGNPIAVAGLAIVAAISERGRVSLGGVTEASISLLPTVFAAGVFGPLAGSLVAAASLLGDFPALLSEPVRERIVARGGPYLRGGIYPCIRAIYGAAAGFAALAAATLVHGAVAGLVLATVTAALVAEPLDMAFATFTLWLRGGEAIPFLRMVTP